MAKNRMINTRFWNDDYASNLDPTEKLVFLYLLTNDRSTLAGIYELPKKIMAVETGIETEMVAKILSRFEDDGKINYSPEKYKSLGEYWENLGGRWGGRFGDNLATEKIEGWDSGHFEYHGIDS